MDWDDVAGLLMRFPLLDFWLPEIAFVRAFGPFAATVDVDWYDVADLMARSALIAFCLPATACLLACAAFLATIGLFTKRDGDPISRFLASAVLAVVAMVHGGLILFEVWHGVFINPPDYWRAPLLGLTAYVVFASACVLLPRGRAVKPLNPSPEIV